VTDFDTRAKQKGPDPDVRPQRVAAPDRDHVLGTGQIRSTPTTVGVLHVNANGGRARRSSGATEVVRRSPLDNDEILGALDQTAYQQPALANTRPGSPAAGTMTSLGGKLDQSTASQTKGKQLDPVTGSVRTETMRQRVEMVMDQYRSRFADEHGTVTNNAMLIAIAVQGAGRIIADELYDPSLAPQITEDLADLYRNELRRALPKDKDGGATYRKKSIELAKILGSDEPLSLFMHGDLPAEVAATRIRTMAHAAGMPPKKMYALLRQKFEAEVATFSLKDADARAAVGAYSVREVVGEVSVDYLIRLFPELATADKNSADSRASSATPDGPLQFGAAAQQQLDTLERLVASKAVRAPATGTTANGVALTPRQAEHLAAVQAEDASNSTSREAQVHAALMAGFAGCRPLTAPQATKVIVALKTKMSTIPLTVTVKGYKWFGDDASVASFDPVFRPGSARDNKTTRGALAGKPGTMGAATSYLGKWTGASDRPDSYGTFRNWKDQRMTGNRGMTDDELPAFGALNANFAMSGGAGGVAADMNKAYKAGTGKEIPFDPNSLPEAGIAYYGDVHFVLDPAKVSDRVVYTATDHGRPHRDPFLMFADLLCGDGAGYKASITGVENMPIQNANRAALIINAVLDGKLQYVDNLAMEIQIFGGLDLSRDAKEAYVPGKIPPIVAQRIMAVQDKFKIPFKLFEPPTDGVFVKSSDALLKAVTDQMEQI
jgi:hypothetical protein